MYGNWEYFRHAVLVLIGPGAIKQRLIDAYLGHLSAVKPPELPEPAGTQFAALVSTLKCGQAAGGLSCPEVAVRKMSELDAERHAHCILDCFVALSAQHAAETEVNAPPRLRVVEDLDDEDLPAFLSRA